MDKVDVMKVRISYSFGNGRRIVQKMHPGRTIGRAVASGKPVYALTDYASAVCGVVTLEDDGRLRCMAEDGSAVVFMAADVLGWMYQISSDTLRRLIAPVPGIC